MDITPLYELRERLKVSAIAGTGLASDDFRLKRAVEAFAPLEKASPVFAKIGQLSRQVLNGGEADRAGVLLDALALLDAVLCTQAAVGVKGEIEPAIPGGNERERRPDGDARGGNEAASVRKIPYSTLSALLDALRSSGSGRYSYVTGLHEKQPELFEDYRVKAALVEALGASYAELADTVADWLKESGRAGANHASGAGWGSGSTDWLIRALKKGFDPKGIKANKEMVRRIQVMEAVAGAQANDFYVSQLPEAEKEIRGALIYALRHSPDNEELLLSLVQTERGNNRKMACYALAHMGGEGAWRYFHSLAEKKPAETAAFLTGSGRQEAAELTAEIFRKTLSAVGGQAGELDQENAEILKACLSALPGKTGQAVCAGFRSAAALGNALDVPLAGKKDVFAFDLPQATGREGFRFSRAVPAILQYSLLINPAPELTALAKELYEACGEEYFPVWLSACLLTEGGEACLAETRAFLEKKTLLGRKVRRERIPYIRQAFLPLRAVKADAAERDAAEAPWACGQGDCGQGVSGQGACGQEASGRASTPDAESAGYELRALVRDPADQTKTEVRHFIPVLPSGLVDLLMELEDGTTDRILAAWIRPEDEALCGKLADYFHRRALQVSDNRSYLEPLRRCGAPDCGGLAVSYFKKKQKAYSWEINYYFNQMPGTADAKAAEAGEVLSLLKKGAVKGLNNCIPVVEDYIREMEAGRPGEK